MMQVAGEQVRRNAEIQLLKRPRYAENEVGESDHQIRTGKENKRARWVIPGKR